MFTMQIASGIPIYEQLEKRISELIISGEMEQDEKLPAVREIAKQLTVNPNTVQKTYQRLEQRGLIYSLPGKGSYVSGREKYIGEVRENAAAEFRAAVIQAKKSGLARQELIYIIDEADV